MTPIIIDIEASGFGKGSYPIEIGVVLPNGDAYCTLIKPEPGWTHWDSEAEWLHGISRATIMRHGKSAAEVAHQLNELLKGETAYCDGWCNDTSWLGMLFEAADEPQLFRLETLRKIMAENQTSVWNRTKESVSRELSLSRHRASTDALVLQATYIRTRQ